MTLDTARPDTRSAWDLPALLGVEDDLAAMRALIAGWLVDCDPEVREMVQRQLSGRAKYFRPVTVFACHRAITDRPRASGSCEQQPPSSSSTTCR